MDSCLSIKEIRIQIAVFVVKVYTEDLVRLREAKEVYFAVKNVTENHNEKKFPV
tara:strand:+ start:921 stop:1082 length:162 start_codon:yes stop_codon:yes gene_type:complete